MKATIYTIVLSLLISTMAVAQKGEWRVELYPYEISDVGQSSRLNVAYELNRNWSVYGGMRYLHNLGNQLDAKRLYLHHRFRASNTFQHIGYNVGVRYQLPKIFKAVDLYAYYDLSYYNADTYAKIYTLSGGNQDPLKEPGRYPVKREFIRFDNVNSLESNIGIGLQSTLVRSLYFTARGGVGVNFISNLPNSYFKSGIVAQNSLQLSFGLGFKF